MAYHSTVTHHIVNNISLQLYSHWNQTRHVRRTIIHSTVGLSLGMFIMLELIKLENVFASLFLHLPLKQLDTCLGFLSSPVLYSPPSSLVCSILPGANFSTSLLVSLPLLLSLIPCLSEKSADEQLNTVLPQGDKVTPACVAALCVCKCKDNKCSKYGKWWKCENTWQMSIYPVSIR